VADNLELARRGYEALAAGDLEVVAELLDPAVRWHGGDPDAPGACNGRDQALEFIRAARSRGPLPDVVEMTAVGDRVVAVLRPRPSPEDGPTDASEPALRANLTTFRDGKVIEMIGFEDPERAFRAAGEAG
jgi:ketosteroid isomerase-like protein